MEKKGFEENLKELENVVKTLEGGETSLEEMLALFEKGIKLTKSCTDILEGAEQKINMLVKDANGDMSKRPFETE